MKARNTSSLSHIHLLGVRIHTLSVDELIDLIADTIHARGKMVVTYVNAHGMNLAYQDPWFRKFLNNAEIVFCDGFGVKWGARLLNQEIPHRFTPPDWIPLLSQRCVDEGFSMYFLGSQPGVSEEASANLIASFPDLKISGTHHGYFNKQTGHPENDSVIREINTKKPDILLVGFGMPIQERWIEENWEFINANIAITIGAAFDYITGEVTRVPRWLTDNGFEWLGRLIIEPRRLWKRYLIGNPLFIWRVLKQRWGSPE
jgi:N-acetylglucosaminyldiphosphoundecaprenol N-acetyl-beta-D-mannosaminyltransferase